MASGNIVFMIIGIIALLESLIILIFPKSMMNLGKKWLKPKAMKNTGIIELIIAIALLLIGMNV